jgi:hypothetical protein
MLMPTLSVMKSLVLLALALVVVAVVPPAASQSKATTEIPLRTETDKWQEEKGSGRPSRSYSAGRPESLSNEPHSRKMVLTIDRTTPVERIQISVVDGHLKNTILFESEGWELLELKKLVDKAVVHYRSDREILRAVNSRPLKTP